MGPLHICSGTSPGQIPCWSMLKKSTCSERLRHSLNTRERGRMRETIHSSRLTANLKIDIGEEEEDFDPVVCNWYISQPWVRFLVHFLNITHFRSLNYSAKVNLVVVRSPEACKFMKFYQFHSNRKEEYILQQFIQKAGSEVKCFFFVFWLVKNCQAFKIEPEDSKWNKIMAFLPSLHLLSMHNMSLGHSIWSWSLMQSCGLPNWRTVVLLQDDEEGGSVASRELHLRPLSNAWG